MQSFYIGVKALIRRGNKLLVLHDAAKGKWELPGGRLNHDEDFSQALRRELQEELGCKLTNENLVGTPQLGNFYFQNGHRLCLLFYEAQVILPKNTAALDTLEHDAVQFVSFEMLKKLDMFEADKAAALNLFRGYT